MKIRLLITIGVVVLFGGGVIPAFAGESPTQGLVVYVGDSTGEELAQLYSGDGMLVHGLVGDAATAATARAVLRDKGLIGPVNVSVFDGKTLPFIDNTVNTLMLKPGSDVASQEILRVLAPGGTAQNLADGKTFTKPWPKDTDEWPQYLHDPGNNAVAHDDRVGPPMHLQWRAGPRWSRHHDHMSSVSAVVTAGGRIFSIMDEGSVSSILLPSDWKLIARDAFNGLRLWDRGIDEWQSRVFALKSGPATLPRRLATDGKLVYATLGLNAQVSVLDAATGKTIGELATGGYPREILLVDDMVLVVVSDDPMYEEGTKPLNKHSIHAFDKKGKKLWQYNGELCLLTLGADSNRVYFYDYKSIVAIDRRNGKKLWSTPQPRLKSLLSQDAPILVIYENTVLFADPQYGQMEDDGGSKPEAEPGKKKAAQKKGKKGGSKQQQLIAMDASTGKVLWKGDQPPTGYRSVGDVLVVDGLVWNGPVTAGTMSGIQSGRDLRTGKTEREWPPTVDTYWFHHRCYRAKATDKYLLLSRTGIEYVDVKTGNWDINHYVRGACLYGVLPANGFTYVPPHPCSCYPETKFDGFNALAASSSLSAGLPALGADAALRLEKGPAFSAPAVKDAGAGDWPTFRYAMDRCGYSSGTVGANPKARWSTDLGTRATQPIVVGDRLYVSTPETDSIQALDAKTGQKVWSFTAGGKSDTPPTWYKGRLLFGATDGYVYCLNAADGQLAWRFRAAPLDRRLVQFERVESVWPVNGNILVNQGEAVFVAGRSIFLDGGLRFIRLDAMTGKLLHESSLDRIDDRTGGPIQDGIERLNMPVGMPDLLGSDGDRFFMRSEILDWDGRRIGQAPHSTQPIDVILDRPAEDAHLFAPSGFAEDGWWHRTYWSYGSTFTGGHDGYYQSGRFTPSGRILVHDGDKVYGYRRKAEYYRWISTIAYEMYSAPRKQEPLGPEQREMASKKGGTNKEGKTNFVKKDWTGEIPIVLRAMAGAGNRLLLAGPPAMMNEKEMTGDDKANLESVIDDSANMKKIVDQQRSEDGELGGKLIVMDPPTGKILQTVELTSPPVFDGLIAANGKIYMSALDGTIRCFGE